jgi:hypothetical protein
MPGYTTGYQGTLVEAFFFEQDQHLRKAFRERLERMDRRAQLAQISGIHDEAVLDRLIELGIDPETLAALEVVPLVFVAWADLKVQQQERKVVLDAAKAVGVKAQDGRYPILEHWLNKRPRAEMLEAWEHYVRGLCQKLNKQEIEDFKLRLLDLARKVAQAAGGFLGFGDKTSAAEQTMLTRLEKAFS